MLQCGICFASHHTVPPENSAVQGVPKEKNAPVLAALNQATEKRPQGVRETRNQGRGGVIQIKKKDKLPQDHDGEEIPLN